MFEDGAWTAEATGGASGTTMGVDGCNRRTTCVHAPAGSAMSGPFKFDGCIGAKRKVWIHVMKFEMDAAVHGAMGRLGQ